MTYALLIGQRSYSSWSLRGWLPFDAFDIPYTLHRTEIYGPNFAAEVEEFAGGRTVPAAIAPDGSALTDSLSIAWHLAEAFPDKGLLPKAGPSRAMAQCLIAEMHSGFSALRNACPMNLQTGWDGFVPSTEVNKDLADLDRIWSRALAVSGGPFLLGAYTLADVFYAPVAARIAGYGLPISPLAKTYVSAQLAHPSMRRWRAMALAENRLVTVYDQPLKRRPYPAPKTRAAKATNAGPSVNNSCPYSGLPVTDFLVMDANTYGFCNTFCRDKTLADPEAWPRFMALIN